MLLSSLAGLAPAGADTPMPAIPKVAKPAKAKIPYRVVKLMPETQEALVFDREHDTHLMVQIGDDLGEFQVIDVDDEELVLWRDGREVVLTVDPSAPMPAAVLAHRPPRAVVVDADDADDADEPAPVTPAVATPAVVAPAVGAPVAGPGLMDPYAVAAPAPAPVIAAPAVVAPATLDPYAHPSAPVAAAPVAAAPVAAAPAAPIDPNSPHVVLAPPEQRASLQAADVIDPYAEPKTVAAPAGAAPMKGVPAPQSEAARAIEIRAAVMPLQRAQLEAAVASFDKLAKDIGFERTARGIRLGQVAPDSYAYGLGLRGGDVIAAIDGAPLRGLDDAAAIYVRLGKATNLSLDIERGTSRGTLRFTLR